MSSNDDTKFADWVAYRISAATIGPTQRRIWRPDPLLDPEETLEPQDYRGAHQSLQVDRGHQAPLASFTGTPYGCETNYLSNITPQKSALNRGPWLQLEKRIRMLAQQKNAGFVYVLTGPLYEKGMPSLPHADETHRVPSGYWKIVALPDTNDSLRVAAFLFDQNTPQREDICRHQVTVDAIEQRSSLDFFWQLSDEMENRIEQQPGSLAGRLGCANQALTPEPPRFTCGAKRTCREMRSCEEARFYLTQCGQSKLDRDKDGIPCERLCN